MTTIWSPQSLQKEADFTLSLTIPESSYDVKNPDGTSPVVALKVEAGTIAFALQVLSKMHDDQDILYVVGNGIFGDAFEDQVESDPQGTAAKMAEIHTPFLLFSFDAVDDNDTHVSIELTSPSGLIAIQAFQAMTKKEKLTNLAASFMPSDDDDDDEDDF